MVADRPLLPFVLLAASTLLVACAAPVGGGYGTRGLHDGQALAPMPRQVELVALDAAAMARFAAVPQGGSASYQLGVGDVVHLHIVDEPELTLPSGYAVEADGAIAVPYLGRVPAAGREIEALRADLVARLRPYHARPQVLARIIGFNARSVAVVGAVRQPSNQPITDRPLTVIDAINAAGGFADDAATANVVLVRGGAEQGVDINGFLTAGRPLPVLRDGDVVRVSAGGAMAPRADQPELGIWQGARLQRQPLPEGLTLASAAYGLAPGAGHVLWLLRPEAGRILALSADSLAASDPSLGGQIVLRAGDVLALLPLGDPMTQLQPVLGALSRE